MRVFWFRDNFLSSLPYYLWDVSLLLSTTPMLLALACMRLDLRRLRLEWERVGNGLGNAEPGNGKRGRLVRVAAGLIPVTMGVLIFGNLMVNIPAIPTVLAAPFSVYTVYQILHLIRFEAHYPGYLVLGAMALEFRVL